MLVGTNRGGAVCLSKSVHAPSAIAQWIVRPLRKTARNSALSRAPSSIRMAQQAAATTAVAVNSRLATEY